MKALLLAAAVAAAGPGFTIDLGRYFPSPAIEQAKRATVLAKADAFTNTPVATLRTPKALLAWLVVHDALSQEIEKHDVYVYLRAEEDSGDHADATADSTLSDALDRIDVAAQNVIAKLGRPALQSMLAHDTALARYGHYLDVALAKAAHDNQNRETVKLATQPALESLAEGYKSLRPATPSIQGQTLSAKQTFDNKWSPFIRNESVLASLLIPIVQLRDGQARLQGFAGAPDAAYFRAGLSTSEVDATLAAVRASDSDRRYEMIVSAAAARRLHTMPAALHAWDLDAIDSYRPPVIAFPDAVPLILAAEHPMGAEYAGQFARLFDPASHRVEWCRAATCDETGFSVETAGIASGLFYGSYRGTTDSIRALAHEAGHAVHGQFIDENQPLGAYNNYNAGPHFMSESFAIFNELLLLDHLYQSAPTPAARAYYLHQFLDDATFQVFGSARETDLERSIYDGVRDHSLHTAPDLDALTLKVFSKYMSPPALAPDMKVYWARNRLFFTDPLYDVNYLFAGLLALGYFDQFEHGPEVFARRYVALLKNGFTDSPQVLEKKFLGIDMDDPRAMVHIASSLIERRTGDLERLYSDCDRDAECRGL
jgi:oligoendopeptidase F